MALFGSLFLFAVGGSCGYQYWVDTEVTRAVHGAQRVERPTELAISDGSYVTFQGVVEPVDSSSSIECLLSTDFDGKPSRAVIYNRIEERWVEVFTEIDTDNAIRQLVSRKVWTPKEIIKKNIKKEFPFKVVNEHGAAVFPVNIEDRLDEFPLLSTSESWEAPATLGIDGFVSTRVYEAGTHTIETTLNAGSEVTVVGTIKNKDGVSYIKKTEDNPHYIVTSLPEEEMVAELNARGAHYAAAGALSVILGVSALVFSAKN
eukprot:TRINITY_DN9473_c0_g1_i1.p2 TRINITY_DN9473_c0_g1~~TRINITY_DN9473_c0_g1_i1.p2  ORF type:complete len:260 (-),score=64.59 TRINITY_DN9473_c0_g1_i1:65-844(-)